jgi:hypothetical protein
VSGPSVVDGLVWVVSDELSALAQMDALALR